MLNGYKTIIGILVSIISGLLGAFGKDFGIDWQGVELALSTIVGAGISLYGYFVTKRGATN